MYWYLTVLGHAMQYITVSTSIVYMVAVESCESHREGEGWVGRGKKWGHRIPVFGEWDCPETKSSQPEVYVSGDEN